MTMNYELKVDYWNSGIKKKETNCNKIIHGIDKKAQKSTKLVWNITSSKKLTIIIL
jgi:hypothetical protein